MRDKRDRAITCVFRDDLRLKPMCSGLYKKICLKESEDWRKVISSKFFCQACLLSSPVLLRKFTIICCGSVVFGSTHAQRTQRFTLINQACLTLVCTYMYHPFMYR